MSRRHANRWFCHWKSSPFFHSVRHYKGALNSYVYDHYGYMILVSVSELHCHFLFANDLILYLQEQIYIPTYHIWFIRNKVWMMQIQFIFSFLNYAFHYTTVKLCHRSLYLNVIERYIIVSIKWSFKKH